MISLRSCIGLCSGGLILLLKPAPISTNPLGRPTATLPYTVADLADLAWQRVSQLGAVHGSHYRQRADQPFNRGAFQELYRRSARLSVDGAFLLQEGVSADARRDVAAGGAGPRGGPAGVGRGRGPEGDRMEREYFEPLRRRSRGRGQGRRHAGVRGAAGDTTARLPGSCRCPRRYRLRPSRSRFALARRPLPGQSRGAAGKPACCWRSACRSTARPSSSSIALCPRGGVIDPEEIGRNYPVALGLMGPCLLDAWRG